MQPGHLPVAHHSQRSLWSRNSSCALCQSIPSMIIIGFDSCSTCTSAPTQHPCQSSCQTEQQLTPRHNRHANTPQGQQRQLRPRLQSHCKSQLQYNWDTSVSCFQPCKPCRVLGPCNFKSTTPPVMTPVPWPARTRHKPQEQVANSVEQQGHREPAKAHGRARWPNPPFPRYSVS